LWRHYPFRVFKLTDGFDIDQRRSTADDGCHLWIMLPFHGVPLLLALPGGNRNQGVGIANLAVQLGPPGSRRLLDDFTGSDPGVRVLFGGMTFPDVHFKNKRLFAF